jgi:coenzyme F420-0:L-glutamate ligase / coenzyme F420-1:gamma-L-glutamate ligase
VPGDLHAFAVGGMPEVSPGDDVGRLIVDAVARSGRSIADGDVVVVAQKIVSKAEGALIALADVRPSSRAERWADAFGKDPRVVEVVLRESRRIVRMERGIIIAETRHGFVCANAGVDASNVAAGFVTTLPLDPDASAATLRAALSAAFDRRIAVIVSDTFGRPWREGAVNVALGVAGLQPLLDYRGRSDHHGRRLQTTVIAIADEIAGVAELVTGKACRTPVAIVRGAAEWAGQGVGTMLVREASIDLFR